MPLPTDPLFGLQWFLKNTGQQGGTPGIDINVETAWESYTGAGIKIGIYDDGVEVTHPDLQTNYSAALQPTINGTPHAGVPIQASDNHGTAVAGLIVASGNNNLGVVGVAYGASFGTARYLGADGATGEALLNQQTLYDVANHSWGSTRTWFGDGPISPGFQTSAANGRGGLGTIMLKAAGNERVGQPGGDEPVGRDANDSVTNASRHIIVVGAITNTGMVAEYSSPSAAILVSAPAGPLASGLNQDVTTDRTGAAGYNNGTGLPAGEPDYATFNGTSAATPVTSGVAALILQANPLLGWRDMQAILAYSARQVGSAMDAAPSGNEMDTWRFNNSHDWNGGGLHFSNDYGFGLVDATTAVRLAENWLATGRPARTSANEAVTTNGVTQAAVAIPDNTGQSLTYQINFDPATTQLTISHVALNLQLNHTAVGDLRIDLTSPNGTTSNLWLGTNAGTPINASWDFSSREFFGEAVAGTWTVTIRDAGTLGTGTLGNISLTASGSVRNADDHYVYTPEFAAFGAATARQTLTDTGGIDIFDAGSILTASSIDLRAGAVSTLAGRTVTIAAGTVVEHAFTGDGADNVMGNDVANLIRAGRGQDTLNGGAGADTLVGGADNDTYYTDDAGDVVTELAGQGADLVYASALVSAGLISIEQVVAFGSGTVTITGDGIANLFSAAGGGTTTRLAGVSFAGAGGNDVFYGSNYADNLDGGADGDVLFGYSSVVGVDSLAGGAGDDVYYVFEADDVIVELAGGGLDTVYAYASIALSNDIEQVVLVGGGTTGTGNASANNFFGNNIGLALTLEGLGGNDWLVGGSGDDTLRGGADNDVLQGLGGANRFEGGTGDDVYVANSAGDQIFENAGEGLDTVYASVNVVALADNIEQLVLFGGATVANGNALGNTIYANNNTVATAVDGGGGNDLIFGTGLADTLTGGLGNDTMLGLAGADLFAYSAAGNMGSDLIIGYTGGSDRIDLTGRGYTGASIGADITIGGGGNALVTFASGSLAGTTITIVSVNQVGITTADFVF